MISFRHATVLACTGADPAGDATVIVEGAVIKDVLTVDLAAQRRDDPASLLAYAARQFRKRRI